MSNQNRTRLETQAKQQLEDIYAEDDAEDDPAVEDIQLSSTRFGESFLQPCAAMTGWGSPKRSKRDRTLIESPKKPVRSILCTLGDNLERYQTKSNTPSHLSQDKIFSQEQSSSAATASKRWHTSINQPIRANSFISNSANTTSKYSQPTNQSRQLQMNSFNLSVYTSRRESSFLTQIINDSASNYQQTENPALQGVAPGPTSFTPTRAPTSIIRSSRIDHSLNQLKSAPPKEQPQQQQQEQLLSLDSFGSKVQRESFEVKNDAFFKPQQIEISNFPSSFSTQYSDIIQPKVVYQKVKMRASSASRWTSRPKSKERSPDISFTRQRKILQQKIFPSSQNTADSEEHEEKPSLPFAVETQKQPSINIFQTQYSTAKQLSQRSGIDPSAFTDNQIRSSSQDNTFKLIQQRCIKTASIRPSEIASNTNGYTVQLNAENNSQESNWFSSTTTKRFISTANNSNQSSDKTPQRIFILRLENMNKNLQQNSTKSSQPQQQQQQTQPDQVQQNSNDQNETNLIEKETVIKEPNTQKLRTKKILNSRLTSSEMTPNSAVIVSTTTSNQDSLPDPITNNQQGFQQIAHKSFKQYTIPVALRSHILNKRFDDQRKSVILNQVETTAEAPNNSNSYCDPVIKSKPKSNQLETKEEQQYQQQQLPRKEIIFLHRTSSNMMSQHFQDEQLFEISPTNNSNRHGYSDLSPNAASNRFISANPIRQQYQSRARSFSQRGTSSSSSSSSQIIDSQTYQNIQPSSIYHNQ